jgi:hypothetical protein
MSYIGAEPNGMGKAERFTFTAAGGETTISVDDQSVPISYSSGQVSVFLNGVKLVVGAGKDCQATNGSTITGLSALAASDVIEVVALSIFSATTVEGTALISTGQTGGTKFLREDGDGTASWQTVPTPAQYNDVALRQDLTTLALRQAMGDNHVAYNLPNSFIDQFESDSGIATETSVDRYDGEYVGTVIATPRVTTTIVGHATRSADTSKFGSYSLKLDGTGDSLVTSDLTAITNTIGTGVWTIDYWAKATSATSSHHRQFSIGGAATTANPSFTLARTSNSSYQQVNFYSPDINVNTFPTATANWEHWAHQRDGVNIYSYLNGIHVATWSFPTTPSRALIDSTNKYLHIGRSAHSATEHYAGYFDEFRISNVKRYTNGQDFSVPTVPYSTDSSTMLLYHFDNTNLQDSSVANNLLTGTLIGNANVSSTAKTKVSGVMLYKDDVGTALIGTDLEIYFTCNGGTNWTEATYTAVTPLFSTGIKMIRLEETTCTSGSDIRYKAVWADQSASKLTQLHGIGINY